MSDINKDVKKAKAALGKTAVTPGQSRAFTFSITMYDEDEESARDQMAIFLEDPSDISQFDIKETSE